MIAHSRKENAEATPKRTSETIRSARCDNTTEFLAATLRAGNAGLNTTAITRVLTETRSPKSPVLTAKAADGTAAATLPVAG